MTLSETVNSLAHDAVSAASDIGSKALDLGSKAAEKGSDAASSVASSAGDFAHSISAKKPGKKRSNKKVPVMVLILGVLGGVALVVLTRAKGRKTEVTDSVEASVPDASVPVAVV